MKVYLGVVLILCAAGLTTEPRQDGKRSRLLKRYPPPDPCNERPVAYAPAAETMQLDGGQECTSGTCYTQNNALKDDLLQNFLDVSVDPCDDFYKYACGGWNLNNDIPPDKEEYTIFDNLSDRVSDRIEDILSTKGLENHPSKPVRNAAKLYHGCRDTDTRQRVGLKPLMRLISELGGWPILGDRNIKVNGSWMEVEVKMRLRAGLGTMMNIQVVANPTDTKRKIISFGYPHSDMELRDWHPKTKRRGAAQWLEGYKALIRNVAILLGAKNTPDLHRDANDITIFETNILKEKEGNDDAKLSSIGELVEKYPNIDWCYLFEKLFQIDVKAKSDLKVLLENPSHLEYLNNSVRKTPFRVIQNYMIWSVVMHLASETNDEMRETIFSYSKHIYGTQHKKPLKTICASLMETFMPIPMSALYVKKYFPDNNKKEIEDLLKEIHAAFMDTIKTNDWMDNATKKVAIEKLETMISVIGYPLWILDQKEVEAMYEDVGDLDRNNFFDSSQQLKAVVARNKRLQWNDANHRVDASYSLGNPLMVNAFYSVWANAMFYPAALLEYPIYRSEGPAVMNFGSIGSILGHELTHGFDEDGSVVGPEGSYLDWWTASSKKNFEQKLQCFIEQYDKYTGSNNVKVEGQKTLNDNLADNGGVRTAYKAFKSYMAKNKHLIPFQRLTGMNATEDQLFFLAYGTVWCGKSRGEYIKSKAGQSTHSPSRLRVTGTMSNLKEFSEAFGCNVGSHMNPPKKCILW